MNNKTYLIIGGTGGIGKAMIEQLTANTAHDTFVFATHNKNLPDFEAANLHWISMDVCDESSIEQAADIIKQHTDHIDWVINCAGLLHTETQQPEKALRQM
ncbi:MAG: SDR family NAD(P)-dependent oxidoreductase, partial [Psychrobacter sp.]